MKCSYRPTDIHRRQYSIQVTDGVQAAYPKFVDEIKDVQSSPYEYTVTSKEDKIGFVLHSGDEVAYSGEYKCY